MPVQILVVEEEGMFFLVSSSLNSYLLVEQQQLVLLLLLFFKALTVFGMVCMWINIGTVSEWVNYSLESAYPLKLFLYIRP